MERILDFPILDQLTDLVRYFVVHQGILGSVWLLFFEESGLPIPLPGDVVISFIGYQIKMGRVDYFMAFITLLVAVLLGSSVLYLLAYRYGQNIVVRLGKFVHLDEKKLRIVENKFKQYGVLVIIFGRHIPGFRVPITFFAGMSKIPYKTFILSTLVSIVFWIPLYLSLGEKLGPRTIRLLHSHPLFFVVTLVPFILFVITLFLTYFKDRKNR